MKTSNRVVSMAALVWWMQAAGCADEQPTEPLSESASALLWYMHPTRLLSNLATVAPFPCLGGAGDATTNGTPVEIQACNTFGAPGSQTWQHTDEGTLVNPTSGRCLDVVDGATENGSRLQFWDCNGSAQQQWSDRDLLGRFVNGKSGRCLDVPNGSADPGTPLQIWDCNRNVQQQWYQSNQKIMDPSAGKCLGDSSGNIVLSDCNNSSIGPWLGWMMMNTGELHEAGAGGPEPSSQCMTVNGTENGSPVVGAPCSVPPGSFPNGATTAPNQQWRWRNDGSLINVGSNRCLDAVNGGTAEGTPMQIWDCNGNSQQAWWSYGWTGGF